MGHCARVAERCRRCDGEPAGQVLARVGDAERYRFDQACRVKAIEQASRLGMQEALSIDFLPNAVYEPEACLQATFEVSRRVGWPPEKLISEIVESERRAAACP